MKHLALLLPAMRMGGAEKACLNFLDDLTKVYRVTLILTKKEGDLLPLVPKCVEIVEDNLWTFPQILKDDLKHARVKYLLQDFLYYLKIKMGKNSEKNYRYLVSRTPARAEYYDCAISYVANVSTQVFCLADRIQADMKIAWMHGETTEIKDTAFFSRFYRSFDGIFAVSDVTRRHFLERFPACRNITYVYYNPIRADEIVMKSKETIPVIFSKNVTNIVTVGRLSSEKGMDMIPQIVKYMVDRDLKIHWYIVGDGALRHTLEQEISRLNIKQYITMVGTQINPYPFIKQCDIYVQPSYEEGYSTTICEAGILGKAVVGTTTSGGIREQIEDNISGILAEPTPESLLEKIEMLIINKDMRRKLEVNIRMRDFSNSQEIKKLRKVVG